MFAEKKIIISICIFSFFLVGFSQQLDCTPIDTKSENAGNTLRIPGNSMNPVEISPNFQCAYTISPQSQVFAKITLTIELKNVNDVIIVTDWKGETQKVDRNSDASTDFYVFPKTSTTVNISAGNSNESKFLLTIVYTQLPTATKVSLQGGVNLNYFWLNSIQSKPVTVTSNDKMTLTLARSGHRSDNFDNYFVIDGDFSSPQSSIYKFGDFVDLRFSSTGNLLTFVGLDSNNSYSSVILNPSTDVQKFTKFAGVTVAGITGDVNVRLENGQTAAVIVVANNADQLVINKIDKDTSSSCQIKTITGPPSSSSQPLVDYSNGDFSIPQLFPFTYFTITIDSCILTTFNFSTSLSSSYYQLNGEQNGFIFSPSYFNAATGKSDFNVTFTYTGDEKKQFTVDVDDVTVDSNGELDVNIYDSTWQKTLSTVITGNQIGTRSRAFGKYLNVKMSGSGTARLKYGLSSVTSSLFDFSSKLVVILVVWISFF